MEGFNKETITAGLEELEEIYKRRGVTTKEKDTIWANIAAFCYYQIQERMGTFYEATKKELQKK